MIVSDLDGLQQELRLTGHMPHGILNKSSYHLAARSILSSIYPTMQILEELPICVRKSEILYLDFYLPLNKIAVEVHGEQHYKFIPYYHRDILGFMKSKNRDKDKMMWCDMNGIRYIELPFNESLELWHNRIKE